MTLKELSRGVAEVLLITVKTVPPIKVLSTFGRMVKLAPLRIVTPFAFTRSDCARVPFTRTDQL